MPEEEESDAEKHSFLRFLIMATLTVAGMALLIISGWAVYITLLHLGIKGEPFGHIAIATFWVFIVALLILAAVVDWVKGKNHRL